MVVKRALFDDVMSCVSENGRIIQQNREKSKTTCAFFFNQNKIAFKDALLH